MSLAHIQGLDHIVVTVRDLAAAAAQWKRLGFTVSPRGLHSPQMGTANHTIMGIRPRDAGTYMRSLHSRGRSNLTCLKLPRASLLVIARLWPKASRQISGQGAPAG